MIKQKFYLFTRKYYHKDRLTVLKDKSSILTSKTYIWWKKISKSQTLIFDKRNTSVSIN